MSGWLRVIGLGPGPAEWVTPAVQAIIADAQDFIGYQPYLERLTDLRPDQTRHPSDNRVELDRARHALTLAASGRRVAVVSGGDPGVFAMASAVLEAIEAGPADWRALDLQIEPGVTAMLAAAARIGAPLGHDFAVISLSDNLKPWALVEKRLRLAVQADLVLAFYNPTSKARPRQLLDALAVVAAEHETDVPVIFARAVGRSGEDIRVVPLSQAADQPADMATMVIVGSSQSRIIDRPGGGCWVYAPRSVAKP